MNVETTYLKEREIQVWNLFLKLLLQWKWILLVACIFAVSGYGYAKLKQNDQRKAAEEIKNEVSAQNSDRDEIDYKSAGESVYETARRFETALNNERDYAENSLLMQMDPYHVVTAKREFELHGKQNIDAGQLDMAGRQLVSLARSTELASKIAGKYNTEPQYIAELIKADVSESMSDQAAAQNTWPLGDNLYVSISVRSDEEEFSEDVLQIVSSYIIENSSEIVQADYILTELPIIICESVENDIISDQNSSRQRIVDYSDRLVRLNTTLGSMEDIQESKQEAKANNRIQYTSGKKYAAAGFIGGAILAVLILLISSLFSSVLRTEEDFRSRFVLNSLGTAPLTSTERNARGIKKKILARLEGTAVSISEESFYTMTAINLANTASEYRHILVTGSVTGSELQNLSKQLLPLLEEKCDQTKFVFEEDLLNNPETRSKLLVTDAVVLVEKRKYARVDDVKAEIEIVASLDKSILGIVLL